MNHDSNTNDYQMDVKVNILRDCSNCKNRFTSVSSEPCCDCEQASDWEFYVYEDNTETVSCNTCKFFGTEYSSLPCSNCSVPRSNLWQSRQ